MERETGGAAQAPSCQPMLLLEGGSEGRSCEHTLGPPKLPVSSHPNPLQGFTTGNEEEGLQVYLCLAGVIRAAVAPQQGRGTAGPLPVCPQTCLIRDQQTMANCSWGWSAWPFTFPGTANLPVAMNTPNKMNTKVGFVFH